MLATKSDSLTTEEAFHSATAQAQTMLKDIRRHIPELPDSYSAIIRAVNSARSSIKHAERINVQFSLEKAQKQSVELQKMKVEVDESERAAKQSLRSDHERSTEEILEEARKIHMESIEKSRQTKRVLTEITETGNATLGQLRRDRETLQSIDGSTQTMNRDLGVAQKQVKAIKRKNNAVCVIL